jgi:hypothetical protein
LALLSAASRDKVSLHLSSTNINSEFVSSITATRFWDFLEVWLQGEKTQATDKKLYERALKVASPFLVPTQASLLDYSLSLHYFNPRLEMYRQLSKQVLVRLAPEEASKVQVRT